MTITCGQINFSITGKHLQCLRQLTGLIIPQRITSYMMAYWMVTKTVQWSVHTPHLVLYITVVTNYTRESTVVTYSKEQHSSQRPSGTAQWSVTTYPLE